MQDPRTCTKDKILDKIEATIDVLKENTSISNRVAAVHDEKISNINVEIKELFDCTRSISAKLENIQKELKENSSFTNKITAVHDEKIIRIAEEIKELFDISKSISSKLDCAQKELKKEIQCLEKRLETENDSQEESNDEKIVSIQKTQSDNFDSLDARIKTLETYKYIVVGAIVFFGYVIDHLDTISSFLIKQ